MKLEGLRVLDLTLFLPGPYLTLALADHGAEVIKVEPPGEGDPTRHLGPKDGDSTVYFRNLNRGKKSVVLDLKNPQDREALLRLCESADVFVESFRPGVVERLGVGYDAVRARNPRIVYCSISAFGQQGPYRDRPAHDLAVEALSGVLMALIARERTGKGDYVDIAMHDSMLAGTANILGPTLAEGRQPVARHERSTGGSAFYRLYETSDGRHLALGGQEMKFVRALLGALGRPELAPLCERPGPHQRPVMEFLEKKFREKNLEENLKFLAPLDVCYAPVNTLPEALAAARDKLLQDELGRRHLASPIRFRDEPARPNLREPRLGEHDALKKGLIQDE